MENKYFFNTDDKNNLQVIVSFLVSKGLNFEYRASSHTVIVELQSELQCEILEALGSAIGVEVKKWS